MSRNSASRVVFVFVRTEVMSEIRALHSSSWAARFSWSRGYKVASKDSEILRILLRICSPWAKIMNTFLSTNSWELGS